MMIIAQIHQANNNYKNWYIPFFFFFFLSFPPEVKKKEEEKKKTEEAILCMQHSINAETVTELNQKISNQ